MACLSLSIFLPSPCALLELFTWHLFHLCDLIPQLALWLTTYCIFCVLPLPLLWPSGLWISVLPEPYTSLVHIGCQGRCCL